MSKGRFTCYTCCNPLEYGVRQVEAEDAGDGWIKVLDSGPLYLLLLTPHEWDRTDSGAIKKAAEAVKAVSAKAKAKHKDLIEQAVGFEDEAHGLRLQSEEHLATHEKAERYLSTLVSVYAGLLDPRARFSAMFPGVTGLDSVPENVLKAMAEAAEKEGAWGGN